MLSLVPLLTALPAGHHSISRFAAQEPGPGQYPCHLKDMHENEEEQDFYFKTNLAVDLVQFG